MKKQHSRENRESSEIQGLADVGVSEFIVKRPERPMKKMLLRFIQMTSVQLFQSFSSVTVIFRTRSPSIFLPHSLPNKMLLLLIFVIFTLNVSLFRIKFFSIFIWMKNSAMTCQNSFQFNATQKQKSFFLRSGNQKSFVPLPDKMQKSLPKRSVALRIRPTASR